MTMGLAHILRRSTDWQSVNMPVLADRVKFRDVPEGKPRHAFGDGRDPAYAPAVHVKASALAGDVASPPLWPSHDAQQETQLSDPRLPSSERASSGPPGGEAAVADVTAAIEEATVQKAPEPLARSDSDDSLVSALSRRSSHSEDRMNENEQAGMALLGRTHQDSGLR